MPFSYRAGCFHPCYTSAESWSAFLEFAQMRKQLIHPEDFQRDWSWIFGYVTTWSHNTDLRCQDVSQDCQEVCARVLPWASQWVIVLPPRCVQHQGSRRTFISIQLRSTSLPLPSTFTRTTCQMLAWVRSRFVVPLLQEHMLSPAPVYRSHTHKSSLVCANTCIPPLKNFH